MKKLLSLIALAGIFAACQPEEIETAFEVPNAVANIKVVAVDVRTNTQVTPNSVTPSVSGATYASGVVTITGNPTIAKQTVTLSVNYKADYMSAAKDYTASVNVLDLRAGGKAEYSVTVVVGELSPIPDYTFAVEQTSEAVTEDVTYFTPADGHALIEYGGMKWMRNNSENYLTGKVDWEAQSGTETVEGSYEFTDSDPEFEPYAKSYADAYNVGIKTVAQEPLDIWVSAYSYYTVFVTRKFAVADYTVYKVDKAGTKTAIATFDVKSVNTNQIEYAETADPDGHGHYEYGHCHGHGGDNAGGGIVYAD